MKRWLDRFGGKLGLALMSLATVLAGAGFAAAWSRDWGRSMTFFLEATVLVVAFGQMLLHRRLLELERRTLHLDVGVRIVPTIADPAKPPGSETGGGARGRPN